MKEQQKQFVMAFLAYAVQRDISIDELCRGSQIDVAFLKQKQQNALTESQINALWRNASELSNDSLFGLHFGESLQLAALGAVGEIIKNSETVGQALTIGASFTSTVTSLFVMDVARRKNRIIIQLVPNEVAADEFVARQVADFLLVFTAHELNGLLLKKIKPDSIQYPYKPERIEEFERVFQCLPFWESKVFCMEFDAVYWDEPIIAANYDIQKLFLQKVAKENSGQGDAVSFQIKVMDHLMKNSCLGIPSLEDVAANFNMTSRSLQRRLQDESATFQQIADSVRKSLALHYVESGKYQLKEISAMLGYNELSAFSRAFKRWTGEAPIHRM